MQKIRFVPAALFLATAFPAYAAPADPAALRDAALSDGVAWDITEGLTTQVGPRPAASEAEARARAWGVAKLKALGFSNVHIEEYQMPAWIRGEETASIVSPFPQKLVLTALGNSGSTGPRGLEAEVVYFPSYADLQAAPDGSLKGKIAFVTHAMKAAQDGSSYGAYGPLRFKGPNVAAKKGAAALVIKSIGTDHHRTPHTGVTQFDKDVKPIPAAALSVPDAENLERMVKGGQKVVMKLVLTPQFAGMKTSGNVIAEVPGSDPSAGVIVVAGHLDSWDLGTGAIDDASGVAIVTAAARRIMDSGQPRRTIRILWAGAEEVGGNGGEAYFAAHKNEKHVLAMESDFGADRVWRATFTLPDVAQPVADRIATALSPIGVTRSKDPAHGGTDIEPLINNGVPVLDLDQDGTRYFDIHHTPDDTLDKIDPAQLSQNVAAWTATLAIAANAPESLTEK